MTSVVFDVVDVVGEALPGDSVVVWPPHVVGTADGKVKNTRPETIPVDAGPVTVNLDPGPLWVQLQCGDRADTDPKLVRIPEEDETDGPVDLLELLNRVIHYDPVQESESGKNAARAEAAAEAAAGSATAAGESASAAKSSETAAGESATAAGTSETNASNSAEAAAGSATAAGESATAAASAADRVGSAERVLEAETNASNSANAAAESATAAGTSKNDAAESATAAGESASAAKSSETAAGESATAAGTSETNAAQSASAAEQSANAAKSSETAAAGSATSAGQSATAAAESAAAAAGSETNAGNSAESAGESATRAETAAEGVQGVVENAADSIRTEVATHADRAETARNEAVQAATNAGNAARIEVDKLKGDAPEAYDTLEEIAAWIADNEDVTAGILNQISAKAGTEWVNDRLAEKVDTVHTHTLANITDAPNSHSTNPNANSLVSRSAAGFFFVNRPTNADHPTNKSYVDDKLAEKANTSHTHTTEQVTGLDAALSGKANAVHSHDAHDLSWGPLNLGELLEVIYLRINNAPAFFSGAGMPPSSLPGARVGDYWLNETTMELHKITGV